MNNSDYDAWTARHPDAARDLQEVMDALPWPALEGAPLKSEAWAQQQTRLEVARHGARSWRNNVGATPAKCPVCNEPQQPMRYGLANDSAKLNKQLKSSDLILAIPRVISPSMIGSTIAQFGSVECKRPGWRYSGRDPEPQQAAWLALVASIGGYATFSTGVIKL